MDDRSQANEAQQDKVDFVLAEGALTESGSV